MHLCTDTRMHTPPPFCTFPCVCYAFRKQTATAKKPETVINLEQKWVKKPRKIIQVYIIFLVSICIFPLPCTLSHGHWLLMVPLFITHVFQDLYEILHAYTGYYMQQPRPTLKARIYLWEPIWGHALGSELTRRHFWSLPGNNCKWRAPGKLVNAINDNPVQAAVWPVWGMQNSQLRKHDRDLEMFRCLKCLDLQRPLLREHQMDQLLEISQARRAMKSLILFKFSFSLYSLTFSLTVQVTVSIQDAYKCSVQISYLLISSSTKPQWHIYPKQSSEIIVSVKNYPSVWSRLSGRKILMYFQAQTKM